MATTTGTKVGPGNRKKAAVPKDEGTHGAPGLSNDTLKEMYYYMLLARSLDERMWLLNRQGKAPFVISCQGHEAIQVGTAFALERGKPFLAIHLTEVSLPDSLQLQVGRIQAFLKHTMTEERFSAQLSRWLPPYLRESTTEPPTTERRPALDAGTCVQRSRAASRQERGADPRAARL